ncbi:MAG: hypothetical protein LBP59_04960 [Planctomycetaceae bacterium]|nr:hypothetical protein [Planctomycetaceae bacterium]
MYSTAGERGYISTAFLFALRQIAGETPAIRWSRLHFRIAGISGSPALQDRRHFVWVPSRFFVTKNRFTCSSNCQNVI